MAARKRTTSPAFQFYPKDFISSSKVQRMTPAERGHYIMLLSHYWLDNGLPDDERTLARMLGLTLAAFRKAWTGPLGECFKAIGGRLLNERLDHERKVQAEFRRKQKEKAESRWSASRGNAAALPIAASSRQSRGNASLSPSPIRNPQSAKERGTGADAPDPSALADAWNTETQPPLPRCEGLSKARESSARQRLSERTVDEWRAIYRRVNASPFLRGHNDRGWRASFDWMLKPENVLKVLEGKFDGSPTPVNRGDKTVGNEAAIQRFIDRRGA